MIRKLIISALALGACWALPAQAISVVGVAPLPVQATYNDARMDSPMLLVVQETGTTTDEAAQQPMNGELVLPPNALKAPAEEGEKKCMTVCARWGEECMLINKGAGGMERKCRRTCKQLGEECL